MQHALDKYWRLKEPAQYGRPSQFRRLLAEAGYKEKTRSPEKYLARIQKGLICYDKCTDAELRKFATDRRAHRSPQKVGRATLIEYLEMADSRLEFRGFMDLPPELRNNVYELYVADFPTLLTPSQPPITRVSRQVRDEALSTFYACCDFRIELFYHSETRCTFSIQTICFLQNLRVVDMGRLSGLTVNFYIMRGKFKISESIFKLVKDKTDKYSAILDEEWCAGNGERRREAQKELDDYLKERKLSTGEKKLEIGDIWSLRTFIEAQG